MILSLILIVLALIVGYYFGKEAQKDKSYREDPDNDVNTEDGSLQLLLFTKKERYDYGRAMALGNKKEIAFAKKKLEDAISYVRNAAIEAHFDRQRRGSS